MSYDLSRPDYKIMNVTSPTREQMLEWAFDDDLYLIDQDEDLLLYNADQIPIMLELSDMEDCPKSDYIFNILCEYTREEAFWSKNKTLLEKIIGLIQKQNWRNPEILRYETFVKRLLSYVQPSNFVDAAQIDQQATDLLAGIWANIEHLERLSNPKPNCLRYGLKRGSAYHAVEIDLRSGEFYPERVRPISLLSF